MKRNRRSRRVKVSADGEGLVSRAGVALLRELTEDTGLADGWRQPNQVRMPDASVVAHGKLPDDRSPKAYVKVAPDLAVEVVSPNDLYVEVELKVAEYRSAGVKLIWIITPETKSVLVRRLDGSCAEVGAAGQLSGEDVLPGFSCTVAELFV